MCEEKQRILVVDDDPMPRGVTVKFLTKAGYEVDVCESVDEALQEYEPGKYAVVVTDWKMPEKNGGELITVINSMGGSQPFVIVSGNPTEVGGVDLDTIPIVNKPFTLEQLTKAVSSVLTTD